MPRLSTLLKDAGWGADAPHMSSVIGGESRFDPKIHNTTKSCGKRADGSLAYAIGLAQICSIHLDKGGLAEGLTEQDLEDPRINLKVARKIFKEQGWGAWEADTTQTARQYPSATSLNKDIPLPGKGFHWSDAANLLIPGIGPVTEGIREVGGEIPSVGDVADAVTEIPDAIGAALTALTKQETWFTVAKVVFGGALILIGTAGLVFVVAKNVSSATPIGQIRKAL